MEMDEATRQCGLANIRAIRARMANGPLGLDPASPTPAHSVVSDRDPDAPQLDGSSALDDPSVMAAQMAAGAERERLEQRVDELQADVADLRRTLSDVLKVIASGLDPASTDL